MQKGEIVGLRQMFGFEIDRNKYGEWFNALHDRHAALRDRYAGIKRQRAERKVVRDKALEFIDRLQAMDGLLTEFEEKLWNATVKGVTVQADGGLRFRLKDGGTICLICSNSAY